MQFKKQDRVCFIKPYFNQIRLETGHLGTIEIPKETTGKVVEIPKTKTLVGGSEIMFVCVELDNEFKRYKIIWIKEDKLDCLRIV